MPHHPELEWFDWNEQLFPPPWNQTPEFYTRHGKALPHVTKVDDMYIDPNTITSETVGPPPLHGMTAYPPPADEKFPDDAAHRGWKARRLTRPARKWTSTDGGPFSN